MRLAIFDLDGTLIDSELDLALAVNATLRHLGRAELSIDTVRSYVGNGAPVLMRRSLGPAASEAEVEAALTYFLAYYEEHKLDNTRLYDGMQECLDRLRGAGLTLTILTNKPVRISKLILEGLGLQDYFAQVYGGNSFAEKKPHPIGIDTLRAEFSATPESTVMIGDSAVDVQTARNAGVAALGVTYGLQPEALLQSSPDVVVDTPLAVADWLLARTT